MLLSTHGEVAFLRSLSALRLDCNWSCTLDCSSDTIGVFPVISSFPVPQYASPQRWTPCERADSICSRCRSNDALMPYVKSHHLLSRLTFPLTAPSNGFTSGWRLPRMQRGKLLSATKKHLLHNPSQFVPMWKHFHFHSHNGVVLYFRNYSESFENIIVHKCYF